MTNAALANAAVLVGGPHLPLITPANKQATLAAFPCKTADQQACLRGLLPPTLGELTALPFVGVNERTRGLCYWSATVTGDGRADFAQGRCFAVDALRFMADNKADVLLALILRDLFAQEWTLVAAGFVRELVLQARFGFHAQSKLPGALCGWSDGEEQQWH